MKNARHDQINKQNKQGMSHKPMPEIRDNLDARSNEEQDFKGDDVTHNRKDVQNERKRKGSK
jgi:hypothetical protein